VVSVKKFIPLLASHAVWLNRRETNIPNRHTKKLSGCNSLSYPLSSRQIAFVNSFALLKGDHVTNRSPKPSWTQRELSQAEFRLSALLQVERFSPRTHGDEYLKVPD
jgi:hypothetical protein